MLHSELKIYWNKYSMNKLLQNQRSYKAKNGKYRNNQHSTKIAKNEGIITTEQALKRAKIKSITGKVFYVFTPVLKKGSRGLDFDNYAYMYKVIGDTIVRYKSRAGKNKKILKRGILYDDSGKHVLGSISNAPIRDIKARQDYINVQIWVK